MARVRQPKEDAGGKREDETRLVVGGGVSTSGLASVYFEKFVLPYSPPRALRSHTSHAVRQFNGIYCPSALPSI